MTLRLWIDPNAPASERVCCSPAAVIAARQTCHSLGIPHVTLDLRERFRSAVVEPFTRGYARGETPNPCSRCNGAFRFDELLRFARRIGAERLATGHYARIVERDGALAIARAADSGQGPELHARHARARHARAALVPARRRRRRRRPARRRVAAGLAVAGRPESQEACFLGGDDYRAFLDAPRPRRRRPARSSTRRAAASAPTTASGATRRASAAGSASRASEPLYALSTEAAHEHRRRRAPQLARAPPRRRRRPARPRRTPRRGEAPPPLAGGRGDRRALRPRLRARPRRAVLRRRAGADRGALRRRRRRRRGHDRRRRVRSPS